MVKTRKSSIYNSINRITNYEQLQIQCNTPKEVFIPLKVANNIITKKVQHFKNELLHLQKKNQVK